MQPVAIADGLKAGCIQINAITKALGALQQLHSRGAKIHFFPLLLFEIPTISR
jgi:hypothetical protein